MFKKEFFYTLRSLLKNIVLLLISSLILFEQVFAYEDLTFLTKKIDWKQTPALIFKNSTSSINLNNISCISKASLTNKYNLSNTDLLFLNSIDIFKQNRSYNSSNHKYGTSQTYSCTQPLALQENCSFTPYLETSNASFYLAGASSCGNNCLEKTYVYNLARQNKGRKCNKKEVNLRLLLSQGQEIERIILKEIKSNAASFKLEQQYNFANWQCSTQTALQSLVLDLFLPKEQNELTIAVQYNAAIASRIEFKVQYYLQESQAAQIVWNNQFCPLQEQEEVEIECQEQTPILNNELIWQGKKYRIQAGQSYPYSAVPSYCSKVVLKKKTLGKVANTCTKLLAAHDQCNLERQSTLLYNNTPQGKELIYSCRNLIASTNSNQQALFADCEQELNWNKVEQEQNYNLQQQCLYSENNNCPSFIQQVNTLPEKSYNSSSADCILLDTFCLNQDCSQANLSYQCRQAQVLNNSQIKLSNNCHNIEPLTIASSNLNAAMLKLGVASALVQDNSCTQAKNLVQAGEDFSLAQNNPVNLSQGCTAFSGTSQACHSSLNDLVNCCDQETSADLGQYLNIISQATSINNSIQGLTGKDYLGSWFSPIKKLTSYLTSPLDNILPNSSNLTNNPALINQAKTEFTQSSLNKFSEWVAKNLGEETRNSLFTQESGNWALSSAVNDTLASLTLAYSLYSMSESLIKLAYKCTAEDTKLLQQKALKNCHYVGSYCKDSLLGKCLQQESKYCCFNSPFSRILQEQAHQQLGLSWGSPEQPNCTGLTIEQLQQIDWQKLDLSEWLLLLKENNLLNKEQNLYLQNLKQKMNSPELQSRNQKRVQQINQRSK